MIFSTAPKGHPTDRNDSPIERSRRYCPYFPNFTLCVLQDDERIAVYIRGAQCINRAVDGDIVAFELLPETEWHTQDCKANASTAKVSQYLLGPLSPLRLLKYFRED